jgi:bla regulator protein blaR1
MIPSYLTPLANHLWQSTLFAAAIALMTVAFRNNRAAVRYALWMAVSLKFLIPFSLLVSLGTQFGWRINPPAQNDVLSVMASIAQPFDNAPSTAVATATAGRSILPLLLAALWAVGCAVVVYRCI